jgi:TonB family protein
MTDSILNNDLPQEIISRPRGDRRANFRPAALLVSLVLHGLLFWWGLNSARFGTPSPEKIQAIRVFLQPMELPELAAPARPNYVAPAAKASAPPAPVAPAPTAAPPSPALVPAPAASPAPVTAAPEAPGPMALSLAPLPVAAVSAAEAGRPAAGAHGLAPGVPATTGNTGGTLSSSGQSGSGVATSAPAPANGGTTAGSGLELYKRRLFEHIDAHKIYPPSARRRLLEGQVRVAFTIDAAGGLCDLQVSEGHPLLAEAARQTVQCALPLPLPAGEVELPFKFSFRMDFRLR